MNRLKLWTYMALLLGAGVVNLFLLTQELSVRAIREVDTGLQLGAAALRARENLTAVQAAAVTGLAVKDEALLESLRADRPEPEGKKDKDRKGKAAPEGGEPDAAELERYQRAEAAARAAVEKAAAALSIDLPGPAFWAVANPEWLRKNKVLGEGPQKEAAAFLRDAAGGAVRRGYVRVNDGLWYGVALPAGEGSALVLFLPVDAAWAAGLKSAAGCDVTLDVGTPGLTTTALPAEARALVAAAVASPGGPVGHGRIARVQLERPVRVRVPLLFATAPAARAQAVELAGLPKSFVVLSLPTVGYFAPLVGYQWATLAVMAALLVIGLLLGVLVKTEVLPQLPESILSAAAKIERGDFTARAPLLAGALGTVAGALNKAAEAAQAARQAAPPADPFHRPEAAPEPVFEFPIRPAAGAAPPPAATPAPSEARESTQRLDGAQAPRPPPPGAAESAFGSETFAPRPVARPPAEAAAPPAAAPAPAEDEEAHWRAVHAEFLRVRAECGETTEGLGFERFRPKLQKNKDALLQKYGCRDVRFQVYVKEGKAALKATPVR